MVDYAEAKYSPSEKTVNLKADAHKITQQPNLIIDSILALPKPSAVQISTYLGRWTGQLIVPSGQNTPVDIEIKIESGIVKLLSVIPWNPSQKEESEILHVTKEGKLVFGRVNRGGGLFVTTCLINNNGQLTGEERLVGFNIPENESADFKEQMNFIIKNPNKISLSKN